MPSSKNALMVRLMTISAQVVARSDQAKQQRASEEDNQEGKGECMALLASDNLYLSDHSEFLGLITLTGQAARW
jgi:hypothetical protein